MTAVKLIGGVMLVLGILALIYRGFTYTDRETVLEVGPIEAVATERERVPVPLWVGGSLVATGIVLLVAAPRRHRTA